MAAPKVLILDDDPDFLDIMQQLVSGLKSKPKIRTASSVAQAVELLEEETFALLITDLRMPTADGYQMLTIVRRRLPSQRVIAISGVAEEVERTHAYTLGADLFLEKPITQKARDLFLECIEALLERDVRRRGFHGVVEGKALVDIIQLESLSQSSLVLKVVSGKDIGYIWFKNGAVIDAATSKAKAEKAVTEMLSWKAGRFDVLPAEPHRPQTIFMSTQGLLLDSAQALDEEGEESLRDSPGRSLGDLPPGTLKAIESPKLGKIADAHSVQFLVVDGHKKAAPPEHWECPNPEVTSLWAQRMLAAYASLGEELGVSGPTRIEGLGPERHVAIGRMPMGRFIAGLPCELSPQEVSKTFDKVLKQWLS